MTVIDQIVEALAELGCTDGGCDLKLRPRKGQHTNGGCKCLRDVPPNQRVALRHALKSIRDIAKNGGER